MKGKERNKIGEEEEGEKWSLKEKRREREWKVKGNERKVKGKCRELEVMGGKKTIDFSKKLSIPPTLLTHIQIQILKK